MITTFHALRREGCPLTFAAMAAYIYRTLHRAADDLLVGDYAKAALQLRLF